MSKSKKTKINTIISSERGNKTAYQDIFPEKVSLEKLKAIWNDKDVQYSDEEIYKIREWLYTITNIIIQVSEQPAKTGTIIELKPSIYDETQSNTIRPCEYGRAS